LVEKLSQMCLNSRADSTRRCYKNVFEKWCKWCVSVKLPSFPATEFHECQFQHVPNSHKTSCSDHAPLFRSGPCQEEILLKSIINTYKTLHSSKNIPAMSLEIRAMPNSVLHYDHAKTHSSTLPSR
jgi:hypothetical protein